MAKRTPLFLAFAIGVASGALGRLEPRNGVIDVAGPSDLSVVISHLPIDKGDPVEAGSLIAVLDKASVRKATVKRLEAELTHAKRERDRNLKNQAVISDSESDAREPAVAVAQLLNRCGGMPVDDADQARFRDLASSIGVILETWSRRQQRRRVA